MARLRCSREKEKCNEILRKERSRKGKGNIIVLIPHIKVIVPDAWYIYNNYLLNDQRNKCLLNTSMC